MALVEMKLTKDAYLAELVGQPDCSGRRRFSKRQRPLSKRVDWCPWCRQIIRGNQGCPLKAIIRAALSKSIPEEAKDGSR